MFMWQQFSVIYLKDIYFSSTLPSFQVERVEIIQENEKFGTMNLILEVVASKKIIYWTLQQTTQSLNAEDSPTLNNLAEYLSICASIHQHCKAPRYILHYIFTENHFL